MHGDNAVDVRGVLRGVDRGMDWLAVDRPVLQRDAQHRQRQHRRHDVGQIVDEVDVAVFDLLVEARAGHVVDERRPTLDRGRRQVRVEHGAIGAVLRVVHLQDAAPHTARALGLGDRNTLVALAFTVDVVIVGDDRASGELEHRLAAAGNPVALVGVGPRDRALGVDVLGDLLELGSIFGGVPVEVVPVLLAIAVAHNVVDAQGVDSVIMMACSGQE